LFFSSDSFINSGSIALVHDFALPILKAEISEKAQLLLLRLMTIISGVLAIFMALKFNNLLDLTLFAQSFYAPFVTIPLLMGILGFRTESLAYIVSAILSFFVIIFWHIYGLEVVLGYKSLVPSMATSALMLLLIHYIFGLKGGWIGNEGNPALEAARQKKQK
jgi:Na+/proline symporter